MRKRTILVTGSTDGIGRLTAEKLLDQGCRVIVHGRSLARVNAVAADAPGVAGRYVADFLDFSQVSAMAQAIGAAHPQIDGVINNAGILKVDAPNEMQSVDPRFAVNVIAPYLLTRALLPVISKNGRVVNVVSAAQRALEGHAPFNPVSGDQMTIYAQSKLALLIWTFELARQHAGGPSFIAVNPGSLLASKMVREGLGMRGRRLDIGADVLSETVLGARFAEASGRYFDNDRQRFAEPDAAVGDPAQIDIVLKTLAAQKVGYP